MDSGVRSGNVLVTITFAPPPNTTAPTLSVSHTPDGTNGWNKSSLETLDVAASDSGSGLAGNTANCRATVTVRKG